MTARIIDGKARAQRLDERSSPTGVAARVAAGKAPPGLAVVLVGDNPASQVYVRNKRRIDRRPSGMRSFAARTAGDGPTQAEVLALVQRLGADPARCTASWCSCRCPSTSTVSA